MFPSLPFKTVEMNWKSNPNSCDCQYQCFCKEYCSWKEVAAQYRPYLRRLCVVEDGQTKSKCDTDALYSSRCKSYKLVSGTNECELFDSDSTPAGACDSDCAKPSWTDRSSCTMQGIINSQPGSGHPTTIMSPAFILSHIAYR